MEATAATPNFSRVRLLILDFDGVLTDNRVLVNEEGLEAVFCHRGDGLGLEMLRDAGLEALVLSKERNLVVAARCRKLGLACHQGQDEKLTTLKGLCSERSLSKEQVAYVGNDVNDLECMSWVGLAVAVADAEPVVVKAADFVTRKRGGLGAVREVCDLLLEALG